MRVARTDRGARRPKYGHSLLLAVPFAMFLAVVPGPTAAADTSADGVVIRIYAIQASGLSTYDCSIQVEVHNQLEIALEGFAATLDFFDADSVEIARKTFEMTRIRPMARRREGLGFKLTLPTDRQAPRDMTELIDQCDVLASAEISLRACETGQNSIFARCQAALAAHAGSELPLAIRRDGVAEVVDYGVVALPRGHRTDIAEQTVIDRLGLTVSTISDDLAWQNGLSPAAQGLLVVALVSGGPAEAAGLRPGDVIAEIDQDMALTPEDAMAALNVLAIEGRSSLLLLLDRNGEAIFAVARAAP